jgi:hypothetical protein
MPLDDFPGTKKRRKLGGIRAETLFHAGNTGSNPVGDANIRLADYYI